MDQTLIAQTPLFRGISQAELDRVLPRLEARTRRFAKGETVLQAGDGTDRLGLVLSGGVYIQNDDAWGNRTILGHMGPGQVFAETYACTPGQPLMVSAVAGEESQVLFCRVGRLLEGAVEPGELTLVRNLLAITARKNLDLSRRAFYTSSKTIRGRLLAYLSDQAVLQESDRLTIPFDRQQLADYLGVDRSALSKELGKLRQEGLLSARKNVFSLHTARL